MVRRATFSTGCFCVRPSDRSTPELAGLPAYDDARLALLIARRDLARIVIVAMTASVGLAIASFVL